LFYVETGRGGSLVFDTEAEAIEWAQQNRRAQSLVSPDEADEVFKSSLREQLAVLGAPSSEEQDAIDRVKELLGYSDEAARRLVYETPEEQLSFRVSAAVDAIVDFPISLLEQSHLVEGVILARMRKANRARQREELERMARSLESGSEPQRAQSEAASGEPQPTTAKTDGPQMTRARWAQQRVHDWNKLRLVDLTYRINQLLTSEEGKKAGMHIGPPISKDVVRALRKGS
jgi:hypothetical protein